MPKSEALKNAQKRYKKANVKTVTVQFYPKDMELFEFVHTQPNKAGFIKELIREHMEKLTR